MHDFQLALTLASGIHSFRGACLNDSGLDLFSISLIIVAK